MAEKRRTKKTAQDKKHEIGNSDEKDHLLERMKEQALIDQVSVFNSPILSLKVLAICIGRLFFSVFTFVQKHLLEIVLIVSAFLAFMYLPIVEQSVSPFSYNICD